MYCQTVRLFSDLAYKMKMKQRKITENSANKNTRYTRSQKDSNSHEQTLPNKPQWLNQNERNFISKMVADEMTELQEAKTIGEQADALVDAIYYLLDAGAKKGINLDPIFKIVHHANMQKLQTKKANFRSDGKILKPSNWIDPGEQIEKEISQQIENGAFHQEKSDPKL